MKKDFLVGMILTIMGLCFLWCCSVLQATAQVVQKGNVFIAQSNSKIEKDTPILTKYFYQTADGTKYPIYQSSKGKCFIIRTSKNGKTYRQYLPEITKQLSK